MNFLSFSSILSIVGVLSGLILLVAALRGRRVGDAPHCARCGYDLSRSTGRAECPECGAVLAAPGSLRIGRRRTSPLAAAIGGLVLLLSLGSVTLAVASAVSPSTIAGLKPVWWLKADLAVDAAHAPESAAELEKRRASGSLAGEELASVIDTILKIQADPSEPNWHTELGTFMGNALFGGSMSAAQEDAFLRNGLIVQPGLKGRVRSGGQAVFWISTALDRLIDRRPKWGMGVSTTISELHVEFIDSAGRTVEEVNATPKGSVVTTGPFGSSLGVHMKVPVPPGEYTARLRGAVSVIGPGMKAPVVLSASREMPVIVVAPADPLVVLVRSPDLRARMKHVVRDVAVRASNRGDEAMFETRYVTTPTPVWLVGAIVCEQADADGKVQRFELVDSVSVEPGQLDVVPQYTPSLNHSVIRPRTPGLRAGKARVILVPDIPAAEQRDGLSSVWAEEIDLGEVEIPPP